MKIIQSEIINFKESKIRLKINNIKRDIVNNFEWIDEHDKNLEEIDKNNNNL